MDSRNGLGDDERPLGDAPSPPPEDHAFGSEEGAERVSVHVYGGKAALCFEADETRGAVPTIALDAASATGPRQYDWRNKVRVQWTKAELPAVLAVLIGGVHKVEFRNHGPDNDKGYSVEHQGDKFFVRVWAKDRGVRAVPVPLEDAFYVTELILRQLHRGAPWMTAGDILQAGRLVLRPKRIPSE